MSERHGLSFCNGRWENTASRFETLSPSKIFVRENSNLLGPSEGLAGGDQRRPLLKTSPESRSNPDPIEFGAKPADSCLLPPLISHGRSAQKPQDNAKPGLPSGGLPGLYKKSKNVTQNNAQQPHAFAYQIASEEQHDQQPINIDITIDSQQKQRNSSVHSSSNNTNSKETSTPKSPVNQTNNMGQPDNSCNNYNCYGCQPQTACYPYYAQDCRQRACCPSQPPSVCYSIRETKPKHSLFLNRDECPHSSSTTLEYCKESHRGSKVRNGSNVSHATKSHRAVSIASSNDGRISAIKSSKLASQIADSARRKKNKKKKKLLKIYQRQVKEYDEYYDPKNVRKRALQADNLYLPTPADWERVRINDKQESRELNERPICCVNPQGYYCYTTVAGYGNGDGSSRRSHSGRRDNIEHKSRYKIKHQSRDKLRDGEDSNRRKSKQSDEDSCDESGDLKGIPPPPPSAPNSSERPSCISSTPTKSSSTSSLSSLSSRGMTSTPSQSLGSSTTNSDGSSFDPKCAPVHRCCPNNTRTVKARFKKMSRNVPRWRQNVCPSLEMKQIDRKKIPGECTPDCLCSAVCRCGAFCMGGGRCELKEWCPYWKPRKKPKPISERTPSADYGRNRTACMPCRPQTCVPGCRLTAPRNMQCQPWCYQAPRACPQSCSSAYMPTRSIAWTPDVANDDHDFALNNKRHEKEHGGCTVQKYEDFQPVCDDEDFRRPGSSVSSVEMRDSRGARSQLTMVDW